MKSKFLISGIIVFAMVISISSCTKDLNVTPIDPSIITSANIASSKANIEGALAKVYMSFLTNGQGGSAGADITTNNDDFNTTQRAMWNMQELPTDEAACAWGDLGISDLNYQTWTDSNPFNAALYDRLILSVMYANGVINSTKGSTDPDLIKYNAEARFLRALAYYYAMDMFGNPPFIDENSPIGPSVYPKQLSTDITVARPMLFNYIVSELHSIAYKLGDPGFSYPRADRAACWMLLAKVYLNAQVYTKTAKWDSCKLYCDSVIDHTGSTYELAKNYRKNFGSNNDYYDNHEMIFAWACDGKYTQGSVGSTFLIQSCSSGAPYINSITMLGLPTNANWGGNRGKLQLLNELIDTTSLYSGGNIPLVTHNDSIFAACKDQRVYMHALLGNQMYSTSQYTMGVGEYKFTNNQVNDTYSVGGVNDTLQAPDYNSTFSSTDVPVFRLADAYLMRAESEVHNNDLADAVTDIQKVRDRAFGGPGNDPNPVTTTELGDPLYLLFERGREFYYEGQRRTDLIRFGQFVEGNYMWTWKGNSFAGANWGTSKDYLNIYPLPSTELVANPNIVQNPGY